MEVSTSVAAEEKPIIMTPEQAEKASVQMIGMSVGEVLKLKQWAIQHGWEEGNPSPEKCEHAQYLNSEGKKMVICPVCNPAPECDIDYKPSPEKCQTITIDRKIADNWLRHHLTGHNPGSPVFNLASEIVKAI